MPDDHKQPKRLIIGTKDGFVVILDSQFKMDKILKEHESQVSCLGSLRNGEILVSGAYDGTIAVSSVYEKDQFSTIRKIEEIEAIYCIEIYDDQRFFTGSDDCMIKLWEVGLNQGENKLSIDMMPKGIVNYYSVNYLKLCKLNKRIIAVNSFNKINLWDIDTGRLMVKLKVHRDGIVRFGLIEFKSFDMDFLANNNKKKKPKYNSWDPNKKDFQLTNEQVTNVNLITKDPIYILSFGEDHKIALLDINNNVKKKVDEVISYRGDVDLNESSMSLMFFTDEREDKIYFLNSINRDNSLNLWSISPEN